MTDLNHLWGKRAAVFWKEAAIYWSYAARSGLSAFLLLFVIIGSYVYMRILQQLPAEYPYWRVTTPLLAVVTALSPFRTFLKPADQVFLMPAELTLRRYWIRCGIYSYFFQALWMLGALILVWPLYVHCAGTSAALFPAVVAAALFIKAASLDAAVSRSKLLHRSHRILLELLSWVVSVVAAFMVLTEDYFQAALVFWLFHLLHTGTVRLLPKHRIPWERWIRKEETQLKLHYTFFSWFADVPKLPVRPKPRRLLAGLVNRLPFDKVETFRYLYAKTFLRSELFGIAARVLAVAVFLFLFVENTVAEPLVYAAALLMTMATVSSLARMHRYSFWPKLYPVPRQLRSKAVVSTAFRALMGWNTLAGAAFLLLHQQKLHAAAAVALGYLVILYFTQVPLRRQTSEQEEDE